jgi:hypothetical protein
MILGSSLVVPACASGVGGHVYVQSGPPRPVIERRAVAPGPRYVWEPGYYRLEGRRYVWVPGRWELPPRARARWQPAHWEHTRRGWYFVDGHWR